MLFLNMLIVSLKLLINSVLNYLSAITMANKNHTFVNGLKGNAFVAESDVFNNTCYCPSSGCLPPGVRSLSLCGDSTVPIFISFPHFYLADSSYRQPIIGMKPNQTLHEFKMILESVSVYYNDCI